MRLTGFLLMAFSIIGAYVFTIPNDSAYAQTEPLIEFGPKQYDKPKGAPVTYTDTFQTISVTGTHTIWVQNGKDGRDEVKHMSISLNGREVITSKDLRNHNPATKPITVQTNNTLTVTLNGKEGNFVAVKILCDGCTPPTEVHIVFPKDGSTINTPYTLVKGTINTDSHEVGILVNGVIAEVLGDTFAANDVPLGIGKNTLIAVVHDASGTTATDTVTVSTNEYLNAVDFSPDTTSGIALLRINFSIHADIKNNITRYEIDFEGDGVIDHTIADLENISYTYTQEGIYYPTIVVTDDQDNRYTDTIAIHVLSREEMDAFFKEKWGGMRNALISQDVEGTLQFFAEDSQEMYREQFTALSSILSTIGKELGYLRLVTIEDNRAEYEIIVTRDGVTYSYFLLFIRDQDGLWKIRRF